MTVSYRAKVCLMSPNDNIKCCVTRQLAAHVSFVCLTELGSLVRLCLLFCDFVLKVGVKYKYFVRSTLKMIAGK